jgi:DNA-binding transcriptional MerR regulator
MMMNIQDVDSNTHNVEGASHYEVFQHEFELTLEDQFLITTENVVSEKAVAPQVSTEIVESAESIEYIEPKVSQQVGDSLMHNVLVDEQLLQEIATIPDRFGFKIGDVADLLGIKQYVLRYWEQEFEILKPKKASNNQRLYTKKDVENAFVIRKLLYRDKFSIEGARQALKDIKFVVKKEKEKVKDFTHVIQKMDHVQDQINQFVREIQKTKSLFTSI